MPEYLAPGVYVEEGPLRRRSIEGVSTSIAGFVGPTRDGPTGLGPRPVTSLREFERIHGDGRPLELGAGAGAGAGTRANFMWHAARAFFENGGRRLHVARVFRPGGDGADDGIARRLLHGTAPPAPRLVVSARFPGAAGNRRVRLTFHLGDNLLAGTAAQPTVEGLLDHDVVLVHHGTPRRPSLFRARTGHDAATKSRKWSFVDDSVRPAATLEPGSGTGELHPMDDPPASPTIRVVTVTVAVAPADSVGREEQWERLALDPRHRSRAGALDALSVVLGETPVPAATAPPPPIVVAFPPGVEDGLALLALFRAADPGLTAFFADPGSARSSHTIEIRLAGGSDGVPPTREDYEGGDANVGGALHDAPGKRGLQAFEEVDEIALVAAPGATFGCADDPAAAALAGSIHGLLVDHCERMRHRFALLDGSDDPSLAALRAMRARLESTRAALYHPWVRISDPITGRELAVPPSGFVAGICARTDERRGVWKAPANEVVELAVGLESTITDSEQEVLHPEGINCLRTFEGRGTRVWGARTVSSDPTWKYVSVRRYFSYLEHSIERGTLWVVFEPNGERLWTEVRGTIEDFLQKEWRSGALAGARPEEAFFVRCDRSIMTQDDLDHGRLIGLVGVAPVQPAEFVLFRIGWNTADAEQA